MRKVLYMFGLLSDVDVQWIAKTGVLTRLRDGDVVTHEGEQTDALIFILEGELVVSNLALGQFARMGVGEIVGEVSLVDSAPASATVTAMGEGLALFLDKETLMAKLAADNGFGSRFYRALAVFLADRLREARRSSGNRSVAAADIADDELDAGILDRVSNAGDRFNRMLKTLGSQAFGLGVFVWPALLARASTSVLRCASAHSHQSLHPHDPLRRACSLDRRVARERSNRRGSPTSAPARFAPAQRFDASLRPPVDRFLVGASQRPRPRIIVGGLLPLALRFEHPCAVAQDRCVFTPRQGAVRSCMAPLTVAAPVGDGGAVRPRIGQIRVGFDRAGECIAGRVVIAHPHLDQSLRAENAGVVGLVSEWHV